ncbi:penicillin-binding transpeptidase domain-containing protein [Luteolibacter sp. LG18]|uniref:penicillin-binding transpeptidase domain-containing protein n=1 Tax=Luteolibacter sp. LG18 TaxID=2819286 RepID=UPI002B31E86C|nr:oxacillin-hydrolyzing class D beta-lactamase OXA-50 [Luteolibacter sp. LG18]
MAFPNEVVTAEPVLQNLASLEAPFRKESLTGTFVFGDPATGPLKVWNPARAKKREIPASTFKIANTVIGLETGAVKTIDEVLPYGGKPQWMKEWEHDMPLREAMPLSAVPIYQELARRVGLERMQASVTKLHYGNGRIGQVVDRFWLDGPLEISPVEQVDFLGRLLRGQLPVSDAAVAGVKEILPKTALGTATVRYKTGWSTNSKPQLGWLVGWLETADGKTTPFALNIDMPTQDLAAKRLPLALACLEIAK